MFRMMFHTMTSPCLLEMLPSDAVLAACLQHMSLTDVPKVRTACKQLSRVPLDGDAGSMLAALESD